MHALSPACNEFLRFISGVTPADPLAASQSTAKHSQAIFDPHTSQTLVVFEYHTVCEITFWLKNYMVIEHV